MKLLLTTSSLRCLPFDPSKTMQDCLALVPHPVSETC
jgi:hypothetical protein